MLIFMGAVLLLYGSMHYYAFSKVWMAYPHGPALGIALLLAGIALTLSPFLVWFLEKHGWHRATVVVAWASYSWMGYLFLFLCIGLLLDSSHIIARLLGQAWPLSPTISLRVIALLTLTLTVYGFAEARKIRVERLNLTTPKLASGQVTIVQISDLHLGVMLGDKFLDHLVTKLRELKPDIVVATGDIVDGQGDNLQKLASHFRGYTPPLGAYAVTGNHEYYVGLERSLEFLRNSGFTVLRAESVKSGGIVLAGVDDPTATRSGQQARTDIGKALASSDDYIVLLKHQPVVDGDTPFDLQLSGHVHGGQIFPFVYLTRMAYRMHTGLTEMEDGRKIYVSRGAGTWGPPIRLFAPPEITLITIASANR